MKASINNAYSQQKNNKVQQKLPMQYSLNSRNVQQHINSHLKPNQKHIQMIKKNILIDAQQFNIHQSYQHKQNKFLQKQKQLETYSQFNKRLQTQILTQKQKQSNRKQIIRKQLKQEYDKQMKQHQLQKKNQKDYQKIYAKQFVQYQDHYYNRRLNDIAKMYNPSAYKIRDSNSYRDSNQGSRLKTQKHSYNQRYNKYGSQQLIRKKDLPYKTNDQPNNLNNNFLHNNMSFKPSLNFFDSISQQKTLQNNPQSYQDYLKKEILRKQMKKDQQKKDKLKRQYQQIKKNQLLYQDSLDQLKLNHRRQQQQFKRGLNQQISVKKGDKIYY